MKNHTKTIQANLEKITFSLTLLALLFLSANVWGGSIQKNIEEIAGKNTADSVSTSQKPLVNAEIMPQYPGGEAKLIQFIKQNLHYPASAWKNGIQGRVVVRFMVTKTGEIANIQVIRGLDAACDNEAVRVIKLMPKWTPGFQKGKNVPTYFTLPILFRTNSK
ncbi:MAG: energy transducer TonB [Bacteroidales bacterium]|nr:energy transducer TonB [Bacteroidales bacterium]